MLSDINKYKKAISFGNIDVYSVNGMSSGNKFLKSVSGYKKVGGLSSLYDSDNIYLDLSDYINEKVNYDLSYPFNSLGYGNSISVDGNNAIVSYDFNSSANAKLNFPKYSNLEKNVNAKIYASYSNGKINLKVIYAIPEVFVNGKKVSTTNFEEDVSIPYKESSSKGGLLFEFNDQEFLALNDLTSEYKSVGDVVLLTRVNKLTLLRQYGSALDVSRMLKDRKVVVCSDSPEDSFVKNFTLAKEGTVALGVKNASGCLNVSIKNEIPSSVKVVQVNFDYKSSNLEKPGYCLFNVNSNTCLNRKYNFVGYSKEWKSVNEYVDVRAKGDPDLEFGLVLEGYKS